jgi:hypothetical protein
MDLGGLMLNRSGNTYTNEVWMRLAEARGFAIERGGRSLSAVWSRIRNAAGFPPGGWTENITPTPTWTAAAAPALAITPFNLTPSARQARRIEIIFAQIFTMNAQRNREG